MEWVPIQAMATLDYEAFKWALCQWLASNRLRGSICCRVHWLMDHLLMEIQVQNCRHFATHIFSPTIRTCSCSVKKFLVSTLELCAAAWPFASQRMTSLLESDWFYNPAILLNKPDLVKLNRLLDSASVISKRCALLRLPGDGIHSDNGGSLTQQHILAQLRPRGFQSLQSGRLIEQIQNRQLRCRR